MTLQKYPIGTRAKVKYGHLLYSFRGGKSEVIDMMPQLKDDIATVEYTYGQKSETDNRFSKGDCGYKEYSLKFDKYGSISWFDEDCLIPIEIAK